VDKIGLRRVLYLRDRDELSASALKTLQNSNTVALLQRRELENYLLDASALTQVFAQLVPNRIPSPSTADISAFMTETAGRLRGKILINRVCRQIHPTSALMQHKLRQRLANENADQKAIMDAVSHRLMTQDELRTQIETAWQVAEADVATRSGDELLAIAPGEEILSAAFMHFLGRGYSKRDDGVAIARAMPQPPEEIRELLAAFMLEET
jgi:hypothetical protein